MQSQDVSLEAQDLLQKIMVVNVKERINYQGILNHPWLSEFRMELIGMNKLSSADPLKNISDEIVGQIESFGYARDYIYRCL